MPLENGQNCGLKSGGCPLGHCIGIRSWLCHWPNQHQAKVINNVKLFWPIYDAMYRIHLDMQCTSSSHPSLIVQTDRKQLQASSSRPSLIVQTDP